MEALSSQARHLLRVLRDFQRGKNYCWPGQDKLAEAMGLTTRSVRRYLHELRDAGLVRWEQQGLMRTNRYFVEVGTTVAERTPVSGQERTPVSGQERTPVSGQERTPVSGQTRTILIGVELPKEAPKEAAAARAAAAEAAEPAAAVSLPIQQKKENSPAADLVAMGLPEPLAQHYAAANPPLAAEVAEFCRERFADTSKPPIRSKPAFMRSILENPAKAGFQRATSAHVGDGGVAIASAEPLVASGELPAPRANVGALVGGLGDFGTLWKRPPPDGRTAQQAAAEIRRLADAERRQAERAAAEKKRIEVETWFKRWNAVWDALPAAEQDRVRAGVIANRPLYAQMPSVLHGECLREMEARANAGKTP